MFNALSNALSGLTASSLRASTAASNIANISTSGALEEENSPAPYSTQITTQTANDLGGVRAQEISKNPGFIPAYDPGSPFANEDGEIGVPNTNLAEEAVNLKVAEIAYKANINVIEATKELNDELLDIVE